jgi:hypothetical protein
MMIVPGIGSVALFTGDVMFTVGGVFGLTVICTGADLVDNPLSSIATAVSAYVPAGARRHVV